MAFLPQRYALAVPPFFVNWYLLRVDLWRCHMKQAWAPLAVCWQVCHSENGEWNLRGRKGGASPAWIAQWRSRCELGVCSAVRGQRILRSIRTECRCELCSCGSAPGPKASAYVTKRNTIHGNRFPNNEFLCGHVCVSSVWKLQWRDWVIWNVICQQLTQLCMICIERFEDHLGFVVSKRSLSTLSMEIWV